MKEININPEDLAQLGLEKDQINQFFNSKNPDSKIKLLEKHRNNLLENIHMKEHQISTLDYFTYEISKSTI